MGATVGKPSHTNIIKCREYLADASSSACGQGGKWAAATAPPQTLRQTGIERIKRRVILEYSSRLGSYGMGGPGFFGLRLGATDSLPAEWLVLCLWGAAEWLLFDGVWVEGEGPSGAGGHTDGNERLKQPATRKPLVSLSGDERWDNLSCHLLGAHIAEATVCDSWSFLVLQKNGQTHKLEIPRDTSLLSQVGGDTARTWNLYESQWDAWVVARGELLL